jgi:hypothetical protein
MRFRTNGHSLAAFLLVLAGVLAGPSGPAAAQAPPNNNCAGAWPLPLGQTTGTNEGSTTSAGSVSCAPIGADVWYSLVTPGDGLLTISTVIPAATDGPGDEGPLESIDTVLAVYSGSCGALVPLGCNDDASPFTLQSEVKLFVTAGQSLHVRVGGFFGDLGSFLLTVSLEDAAPTANDECVGAELVTTPTVSGSTELAFTDTGAGTCTVGGKNLWYAYAAPAAGQVTASLLHDGGAADFDTVLAVYAGSCAALQQVACNDDFSFSTGQFQSEASFAVAAGQLYFLSVGGFLGDSGDFTLSLTFEPEVVAPFVDPITGHIFMLGPPGMTWSQARDHAQSIGGDLATFGSFLESLLVQVHFVNETAPRWIGLTDDGHEGIYTWVTGESFAFASWEAGQPDNDCAGAAENRVAMLPSGAWLDTTETGCTLGPLRALIEFDGPIPAASTTSVGEGCATGTLPVLLGSLPVAGADITLTVLDPGLVSLGVILASELPPATTTVGRCTIQIDLPTAFLAAELVTDAFGFATVAVSVPTDAALVGMDFALQAFLVRASDRSVAATNGLHVVVGY